MPKGNSITVRIKDANGDALEEVAVAGQVEPLGFKYRLISARPGTQFEISITVEDKFDWKGTNTLFVAIAYDDGTEEHLGGSDLTMAWAIPAGGRPLGEHIFKTASKCESDSSALLKTTYSMPDAVASATRSIKPNSTRHRSKESLVSYRGCISIYVHRGSISSHPQKRRPADPVTQRLQKSLSEIAESKERRFKINFESFEPLHTTHGNVCEFHFRNISAIDFATAMAQAPTKVKTKEAGSTTPASDRSATLDHTVARRTQGLRGLPKRDYSVKRYYRGMDVSWHGEDQHGDEVMELDQDQETETAVEDIPSVHQRGLKRKSNRLVEGSDEDDEEAIMVTPRKSTKLEHHPVQAAPLATVEEHGPVVAGADILSNGSDAEETARKRKKLEMEMEEIALAEEKNALDRKAVDLKIRTHRLKYQLFKLG